MRNNGHGEPFHQKCPWSFARECRPGNRWQQSVGSDDHGVCLGREVSRNRLPDKAAQCRGGWASLLLDDRGPPLLHSRIDLCRPVPGSAVGRDNPGQHESHVAGSRTQTGVSLDAGVLHMPDVLNQINHHHPIGQCLEQLAVRAWLQALVAGKPWQ